jgi:hypothetical protein
MPEARAPVLHERTTITITAKRPVLSKEQAQAIQCSLQGGPNIPVELLDDEELLAVVEDGYVLSGIKGIKKGPVSLRDVRRLYEADAAVKVWIDWVIRIRKFVEEC